MRITPIIYNTRTSTFTSKDESPEYRAFKTLCERYKDRLLPGETTKAEILDSWLETGDIYVFLQNNQMKTTDKAFLKAAKKYYASEYGVGVFNKKGNENRKAFAQICLDLFKPFQKELINIENQKLTELKNREQNTDRQIIIMRKIQNAKETLSADYLQKVNLIKNETHNIDLKPSIMIEHPDKNIRKSLVNWVLENCEAYKLSMTNNKGFDHRTMTNRILTALEKCGEQYEHSTVPSLLYIEDFDKFISKDLSKSEKGKIKSLLQDCYNKYHTTILFDTENSNEIDNIAKQPHRTMHIDVENDLIMEPVKQPPEMSKRYDGYRINYEDAGETDIYLGDYGRAKDILWIDTDNTKKIQSVLKDLDRIKKKEKFSTVKKVRCPMPDSPIEGFKQTTQKTKEGTPIAEKIL